MSYFILSRYVLSTETLNKRYKILSYLGPSTYQSFDFSRENKNNYLYIAITVSTYRPYLSKWWLDSELSFRNCELKISRNNFWNYSKPVHSSVFHQWLVTPFPPILAVTDWMLVSPQNSDIETERPMHWCLEIVPLGDKCIMWVKPR